MVDTAYVAPRFSIGRTIKESLTIFGRNFVPFVGVAFLLRLVLLIVPLGTEPATTSTSFFLVSLLPYALTLIVGTLTQAMLTFGTYANLRGQRATFQDMQRGLRFFSPLIGAGIIISIPSIISTIIALLAPSSSTLLIVSGLISGIVSIVLILRWWIYTPVIVIEGVALIDGLSRSAQLLSGRRWSVVGLLLIVGLAFGGIVVAAVLATGTPLSSLGSVDQTSPVGMLIFVISALATAFGAILQTVAYFQLRTEKEGLFTEETARVFE